jgi:hypothetical protein
LHKDGAFISASLLNADGTTSPIDPKKSYTIVATDYMLQVATSMGHITCSCLLQGLLQKAQSINISLLSSAIMTTTNDVLVQAHITCRGFPVQFGK